MQISNELIGKWRRMRESKDIGKLAKRLKMDISLVSKIISGKLDASTEIISKIKDFYDDRERKISELNKP